MKLNFSLEALSKQQGFTKGFVDRISDDLGCLEKAAAIPGMTADTLKTALYGISSVLGAAAISGAYGYHQAKKKYEDRAKGLSSSYNTLLSTHKNFSESPDSFKQRFSELALISPTVASNPRLAHKILEPRLSKGFDLDDVHRLSAIEFHSASSPMPLSPSQAAQTSAWSALTRATDLAIPLLVTQNMITPIGKEVHDIGSRSAAEAAKVHAEVSAADQHPSFSQTLKETVRKSTSGGNMDKKSSEEIKLFVSEECLARMLADRYSMFKTAGILPQPIANAAGTAKDWLGSAGKKSGKAFSDYLQLMAIPLVIGGGVQLVNHMRKQRESAKMMQQADHVFANLRKTSPNVQENLATAQEAFETLKSFAPALAAKPLVARTFVEHVISSDGRIPPDTAQMLANTQKMITQLDDATGGGFIEGLKSPMGLFKHTISGEGDKKHKEELEELKAKYNRLKNGG